MYSLIRPQGLEKNPKLINVGPTSIPEARVCDIHMEVRNRPVSLELWFKQQYGLGFLGCHQCPIVPWDTIIHYVARVSLITIHLSNNWNLPIKRANSISLKDPNCFSLLSKFLCTMVGLLLEVGQELFCEHIQI